MLQPLPIKMSELLRAKMNILRAQGLTASGYVRALLERLIKDIPPTYPPDPLTTRKASHRARQL